MTSPGFGRRDLAAEASRFAGKADRWVGRDYIDPLAHRDTENTGTPTGTDWFTLLDFIIQHPLQPDLKRRDAHVAKAPEGGVTRPRGFKNTFEFHRRDEGPVGIP